jgi:tRNA G37 N-methylase TrmD
MSPSGAPLTQARVRELAKHDHLVLVCGRYEGIDQRVIDTAIDEELSIGDYVLSGGELAALVVIDAVARYVPGVLGEASSTDEESFSAGLLEYPHYTRPQTLAASAVPDVLRAYLPRAAPSGPASGTSPSSGPASGTSPPSGPASGTSPPSGPASGTSPSSAPASGTSPSSGPTLVDQPVPSVLQSGNHAAIAAWRRQQSLERTAKRRPDLFRQVRMSKADRKLYASLRARTHLALVHHPVVDRVGAVITTALTNFDIHDLARSSMTYGLAGYHIVTPITSQREKAANIATLWMQDEKGEHRAQALRLVRTAESIERVIETLTSEHGKAPLVVVTSAKAGSFSGLPHRTSAELVAEATLDPAPMLILLGTGWGLAEALIPSVSRVLAPIEGDSDWNHLSVRSAAAIILDRLFGRPA